MATTQENLKEAFAGESQASQKYRVFAKKAERDGFPNVAKLFRTASAAGINIRNDLFVAVKLLPDTLSHRLLLIALRVD